MKKFIKSFLMAAAALMLFAGCNGLIDATVSGEPNKAVITIGIDGITEATNRSARMINPTPIASDAAPSTFGRITLKGESERGNSIAEYNLVFADGKATIELSYDVWYLTMRAYDKDDSGKLLFEGHRRVDMKNGAPYSSEPLTFKLSAEGVNTPGSVSIKGQIVNDSNNPVVRYTAALYDLDTNEIINFEGENAGTSKKTDNIIPTGNATISYAGFDYSPAQTVKPGRYNFRVYFDMNKGTEDEPVYKTIGTWGDIVVVAPGRQTAIELGNIGDILMKTPKKPANLSAYYLKDSSDGNNYNVLITWDDESTNEEYFELTIKNDDDSDYKVFGAESGQEIFWESDSRVDGTLSAGSEYCIVKLPLEKKFEISLKAVNVVGESESCTRVTTNTTAFTSDEWVVPENEAYGAEKINLMKVRYNLDGGRISSTGKTGWIDRYYIFKNTADFAINLENFEGLEFNHHPFSSWAEDVTEEGVTTRKSVTDQKLTVFANKEVFALYNTKSIVNYEINDSYGTIGVMAKCGDTNVVNGTLPQNNGAIRFTAVTLNEQGEPTTTADSDVTSVEVKFLVPDGKDYSVTGSGNSVNYTKTGDLPTGTWVVQVIAEKKDGLKYSYVFAITKEK